MALKIIIPHRKKIALWIIFTNQKIQQYDDKGSIVEQNKNIMKINTPEGVHIQ